MFPPADDPPDLGIPPSRGPLPVRRNPNSKPNPRVRSGHRRNARPQGFRGETLTLNLTLAFVPAIDTMPGRRGFRGPSSPRHSIATNYFVNILLKLPFTHSFMLTESNPPWRTKCLSDEADEVRIEAVISMPVIVLWSGLDVLFEGWSNTEKPMEIDHHLYEFGSVEYHVQINTCNSFYCDQFTPNSPNKPKMWTENWPGWFKTFGAPDPHGPCEDIVFSLLYHGGTNFGRTSGGPFITTTYNYNAPIDEYARLPKCGHLKELRRAIKSCEHVLLYGEPINL
ncbi:hypothetical protein AAG906_025834 [Vitis piasezkii]